jgi:AcrR family transcriptional regulator
VQAAVLEAVATLLTERGYDDMTMEAVAVRADVHKTTVYRRWPTKAELVFDAARRHSEQQVPMPDTGSLLGDLRQLAREVAANIGTEPGATMARAVVAAAATSSEVAPAMHDFWSDRLARAAPIVERAAARGEIPAATDANLVVESLIGPLWVRLLLTGEPIDDELAERVAELVTAGVSR